MDAWCVSETEGHPVRLESPGRVGTDDDGALVRDNFEKGSWKMKDSDFKYTGK